MKGMTGKKHSEETKLRMAAAAKARISKPHSEETKRKIGKSNSGKSPGPETRALMAAAKRGKPRDEETKRKIGKASKARVDSWQSRVDIREVNACRDAGVSWKYRDAETPFFGIIDTYTDTDEENPIDF
jgi:hypothetical protein